MTGTTLRRWAATVTVAALFGVLGVLGVSAAPASAAPLVPVPSPAGGCPAGIGIGLVDAVVSQDPRGRSYIVDNVDGGAVLSRRIRVCNGTRAATDVDLYPGAADVVDGRFRVLEGIATNELTGWTSVSPRRVRLAPGESALATVRIAVPERVEDGERYGVVLAALPARLGVVDRVGVRMYLGVGDTASRTDFAIDSLQAVRDEQGRPRLRALVRNTGQRAVDPVGALTLHEGPAGTSAGPFPAVVGTTIAPGRSAPVEVVLDPALAAGPWRARITMEAAGVERRAEAVVRWPASGEATPVRAHELDGQGGTVAVAVGLVLLLALLVLLVLLLARRRRREPEDVAPAPPAPAPAPAPVAAAAPVGPVVPVGASAPVGYELPRGVIPAPRNAAVRRALAARTSPAEAGAAEPQQRP